jgi:FtsP/CotA-like multicopper oxidase with cupredoxin domain
MTTRRELLAGLIGSAAVLHADEAQPADFTLKLGEIKAELGPGVTVKTIGYNGQIPGPLLRFTEGKRISVDVINETRDPEMVHWHGFHIPPEVDGAHEEGTPMVQGHDRRRFSFTPDPAGTRWYHAHAMAGHNLTKGSYSGQFGMAIVAPRQDPARYDLEVPIVIHDWEPFFSSDMDMDVDYRVSSINGKMLGAGEPAKVKPGQRVLFRVLNASATMQHRLALPGHQFEVTALDGNAVAKPARVPVLDLAPGERIDAVVDMNAPGIWILGEDDDRMRKAGCGIVVEYAGAAGKPQWRKPAPYTWDYTVFASASQAPEPAVRVPLVIEPRSDGNLWAINGKSWPKTDPFYVTPGVRNRLIFDNRSPMAHPVHLHRHTFEITRYGDKKISGLLKDVIVVPARSVVEADLTPETPGPSLFHCHQQFHMDFGFMALMQYQS